MTDERRGHVLVASMRATVALRSLGKGEEAPAPATSVLILDHVGELAEEWLWGGRAAA